MNQEFKAFQKVLVRDTNLGTWKASFFSHKVGTKFYCVDCSWMQCIPYRENKHLRGTTNMPDPKYIIW